MDREPERRRHGPALEPGESGRSRCLVDAVHRDDHARDGRPAPGRIGHPLGSMGPPPRVVPDHWHGLLYGSGCPDAVVVAWTAGAPAATGPRGRLGSATRSGRALVTPVTFPTDAASEPSWDSSAPSASPARW